MEDAARIWRGGPAAASPVRPSAWELPYAVSADLKRKKERERDSGFRVGEISDGRMKVMEHELSFEG